MALHETTTSTQAVYRVKYTCTGKWPTVCMAFNGGVLDLRNRAVLENFFDLRSLLST